MNKFLIINADDYGYNKEQTEAINELYKSRLITSTSFLCVTDYSKTAAEQAKNENITVGVHLAINSDNKDEPWHSVGKNSSICDEKGLYNDQKKLIFNAKRKEVASELQAQYDFLIKSGVKVDHADNHCGTLYGINGRRFYLDAYDFCKRNNLPYRFPKSPNFIARQFNLNKVPAPVIAFQKHIVKQGEKRNVKMLDDLISNPWNGKDIKDCNALKEYYLKEIENCGYGVTEMFLHPAKEKEDTTGQWRKRVFEYEILKSGDLLEKAENMGIKLISWTEFAEMSMEELL